MNSNNDIPIDHDKVIKNITLLTHQISEYKGQIIVSTQLNQLLSADFFLLRLNHIQKYIYQLTHER